MPVIYIDVLFLINLILDCAVLLLSGMLSGKSLSPVKIIFGGTVGGIYACALFFCNLPFLSGGMLKLAVSALMVWISYFPLKLKEIGRLMISFYLTSFLLGGGLSAIFFLSGRPGIMANGIYYFPLSFFQLMLTALPMAAVLLCLWRKAKNRLLSADKYCTLFLSLGENTVNCQAIIDSGCSLTDPYLGRAAIVIDSAAAEKLLGKSVGEAQEKIRLIPYTTIDSSGGCLSAFTPDCCKVFVGEKEVCCQCTLAVSPADTGGKAIINPDVFTNKI